MREDLWHLRTPHYEHEQWFENLINLHELTSSWIREVQAERPAYLLTRGLSGKVTENLWMLDSLSNDTLEDFLDESFPQEMLQKLEHTIWAVQAWTLTHLYNKSSLTHKANLDSVLEQTSWKLGTEYGSSKKYRPKEDLLTIMDALSKTPFFGYPHRLGTLVRRATPNEVHLELRTCPHQSQYLEIEPVSDRLCHLHSQWMRGFVYSKNNQITMAHSIKSPRCQLIWKTLTSP